MLGSFSNKRGGRASSLNLRPLNAQMAPKRPFYAIGDIHGCFNEMQMALERVDLDIEAQDLRDPTLIFLGDYIDRGPHSAEVLQFLMQLAEAEQDAVVCLKGNHEQMLLDFIDDPIKHGPRWLKFGGNDTLASFGIECPSDCADKEQLYEACETLIDEMPEAMLHWLRRLPLQWSSGNMHCVHAAMDPAHPVKQQSQKTLLWGCDAFDKTPRNDGNWVIHGHTIVGEPHWENGRVALDTGCYSTGILTAAAFTGATCRIL